MYYISIIFILFINKSIQIRIDLKSHLTNTYDLLSQLQFNINLATNVQLYSSQLNDALVNEYFQIENKSSLKLSLNRYAICSNLKYCFKTNTSNECILNLNAIYYLKPAYNTKQINQIKSIKLNIILNAFTNESQLKFNKQIYEFQIDKSTDEIGMVRASILDDTELNGLIRYFLEFNDQDRVELNNLFQIDSNNGSLTINKQYLTNTNKTYEFYVNAVSQCGLGQKPLTNRTLIRINPSNETFISKASFKLKSLIETKNLINSIECLKLKEKDLNSTNQTIALAQIIVESQNQIQLSTIESDLQLFGLKPDQSKFNQLNMQNILIQHLIDNIFVIYLVKTTNFDQIYLNDIYKIQLKLDQSALDIYLCIDQQETNNQFTDSFSLIQFSQNVYHLNPPVYLDSNTNIVDSSSVLLEAYDLGSSNSSIQFYLDDNLSSNVFNLSLEQISSTKTKLIYKNSLLKQDSIVEKLQYELIGIAFDSNLNSDQIDIDSETSTSSDNRVSQLKRVVYNDLTRQALTNKRFLRFTSKILINTNVDIHVNDSTNIYVNQTYKFYIKPDKLVKNTIIGYLPNIYDLNTKYSMSFNSKQIQYLYYNLLSTDDNSVNCFKLNKFDGALKVVNKNPSECFTNRTQPIKFRVKLNSFLDSNINEELGQIWIYDMKSDNKNESSINLIYNANDLELSSNSKNVINPASVSMFSMSYLFNIDKDYNHKLADDSIPAYIKLVDLVSYFQPNLTEIESHFDFKTKFDFIQLDKTLNDLFIIDTKKNSIYLNVTKSIKDKFIQFKCYNLDLIAKNYIYLNSIERKLVSFDSFKLNLCFFNNDTISYKDFVANNFSFKSLIVPFQNENRLIGLQQYLLMNYSENSNLILFIFLLASAGVLSISLIVIATFLKSKKQSKEATPCRNKFTNPIMNRYYSSSIDTTTTYNTDVSPSVLLKIRNDLSFNRNQQGNFIFQDKDGKFYSINTSTLNRVKSSASSNSNSSTSSDLNTWYTDSNRIILQNLSPETIPELYTSFSNIKNDNKDKESSEDQGVYCLATGTSFSMSSNISSVTNSQYVDSYNNTNNTNNINQNSTNNVNNSISSCGGSNSSSIIIENPNMNTIMPLSPIDLTRLSLFDMTPMRSSNKLKNDYNFTFVNELNTDAKTNCNKTNNQMKDWIIQNYYQNCANINKNSNVNYKIKSNVNIANDECII